MEFQLPRSCGHCTQQPGCILGPARPRIGDCSWFVRENTESHSSLPRYHGFVATTLCTQVALGNGDGHDLLSFVTRYASACHGGSSLCWWVPIQASLVLSGLKKRWHRQARMAQWFPEKVLINGAVSDWNANGCCEF
jgi:hypothetical protein